MNKIDQTFQNLKKQKSKAFVAYLTLGDPNFDLSLELMQLLVDEGIDILEIGIPFSDPIGDGPTNQASIERSLRKMYTLNFQLQQIKSLRKNWSIPIVIFSYLNPIYKMGFDSFSSQAAKCGVDGVLTVDGPFDMCLELKSSLDRKNIHSVYLAAPTSKPDRLKDIVSHSGGFVYLVSSMGVTGTRQALDKSYMKILREIRHNSNLPVCLGFGISSADIIRTVRKDVDGIVVGSALVKLIQQYETQPGKLKKELKSTVRSFLDALKS